MEKANDIKQIAKYAKLMSVRQRAILLEQLRKTYLLTEARKLDERTKAFQKKNKVRPPSMKEIVEVVYSVREERRKKHAA